MTKYRLYSIYEPDLGTDRDFTSLRLEFERQEKPTRLGHFSGGVAERWYGYAGSGEEFDIVPGSSADEVLLISRTDKQRWPLTARGELRPEDPLVMHRNGQHVYVILRIEP